MSDVFKNPVLKLLRIIGSPFLEEKLFEVTEIESLDLYALAVKNKIPLLYLETIKRHNGLKELHSYYQKELLRYSNFLKCLSKISNILNSLKFDYCIFKTIKPFPAVPGDIDVLILGGDHMFKEAIKSLLKTGFVPQLPDLVDVSALRSEEDYERAVEVLSKPTYGEKYGLRHISPKGADFIDPDSGVDIDLQKELALSYIVYLDKKSFIGRLMEEKLPDGVRVQTPLPELDLTIVIVHSLMEQMFLLGEFYTLLYRIYEMDYERIESFVAILRENKLLNAARSFLTVSAVLHEKAFRTIPEKVESLLDRLGYDYYEEKRFGFYEFRVPYKYGIRTATKVFLEKIKERRFMESVGVQMLKVLNPKLARLVVKSIIDMRRREYYLKNRTLGDGDVRQNYKG
jgi:hypothetical protein